MGLISSRASNVDSTASPTLTDTVDHASVMMTGTAIATNVTPTTTIKRTHSPAKNLHSVKTPQQQQNHYVRQASVRSRAATPMPNHSELDEKFAKVLVSSEFNLRSLFVQTNQQL